MPELTTWQKRINKPAFSQIKNILETQVAIIGGGICGVLTAYSLNRAGIDCAILESNEIGQGATAMTTAFLTAEIDTDLTDLVSMYGAKKTKQIWQSHEKAIEKIEEIVTSEKIECEFTRCPAYIYAAEENQFDILKKQHEQATKLGIKTLLQTENDLNFTNFGVWEIPKQAKFHPLKFIYSLSQKLAERKVKIFENSEVKHIEGKGPFVLKTGQGELKAEKIIIATYYPFSNPAPTKFKKGMYKSYMYELKIASGELKPAIYWDMFNPYNYFRVDEMEDYDRIILGGQDHRMELPIAEEKNFSALRTYAEQTFGEDNFEIVNQWTGPVLEPSDGLALIGQYDENLYVASAFSGNGMTYSAISAMMLTDLVTNKKNAWAKLYDPTRIPTAKQLIKKAGDYSGELIGGALKTIFNY